HAAEFHDARDLEILDRAAALDADGVADLESLLVRGRSVDDHLVPSRPRAFSECQRIEAAVSVCNREAEVRGSAVDDRLPVVADDLSVAGGASFRLGHVR